jgi:HAE1 family hydrophobic/amphiphilic exporter-1
MEPIFDGKMSLVSVTSPGNRGKAGRVSVGTTVFGGMIAATSLNLIFIPLLYTVVRTMIPGGGKAAALRRDQPTA